MGEEREYSKNKITNGRNVQSIRRNIEKNTTCPKEKNNDNIMVPIKYICICIYEFGNKHFRPIFFTDISYRVKNI